ncbi:YhbY family RNA-binding protein [Desulfosarcina sp. OttesenSCG-928-A07]|nr:YhbY family RNA-binding protein [Desulfosarcina sp. OttesenSCG-928-A07]
MTLLQGFQKQFLRGLAHGQKPVVFVGQKGFSPALVKAMNEALDHHELIKLKFVDFKEKEQKQTIIDQIQKAFSCEMVGMVGHIAIFYREQADPEKRKIHLPRRPA